jgi:hypothetical protein
MAGGYNPGDILIDDITVSSPRSGSWQAAPHCLSFDVFESIFAPAVLGSIEVLDDKDYLGKLKIAGDESVSLAFRTPTGMSVKYSFHLNSIKEVSVEGAMKAKVYKMECISREALTGQGNQVQKAYNTTIDKIISDIHKNFHNSKLPIFTEPTKGPRKFVVTNQPSYHVIENLRQEAVSTKNKGSNYMFWQTWRGFYFWSLEYMLQQGDVKTFKQTNTVGHKFGTPVDNNIISWQVKQNMDAMNRIHAGVVNQRVTTYDIHTHKYVSQDFKIDDAALNVLGKGFITRMATFVALFANVNRTIHRIVNPDEKLKIGKSSVPASIPYKQLNLAQMQEQLMNMTVIGDPKLEPGRTVTANVPKVTGLTGSSEAEPQMSGRWLISKTHHEVRRPQVRPRYVSHLECLKGAYEEKM